MSRRLLLQSILKFSDSIKSGTAKVQDVVEDYFKSSGKQVTEDDRAIIMNEFAKDAPSGIEAQGVEEVFFGPGDTRLGGKRKGPNVQKAGEMSDTPFADKIQSQNPDVELRGDETFGELMEKLEPAKEEGLGSLFPKDKDGFDDRGEVAEFIKKMREAGIKNKDIKGVFKESGTDLAQGKKAATTLARAADMKADTAIKQEALADLDDDIANYGPNWWKGLGYNDGPMGYESYGEMSRAMIGRINNGVMDDLEKAGVPEEKVTEIFTFLNDARKRLANDPKAFVRKVADELEIEDINYDISFWDNYVDEIMSRIEKPEPRFAEGGLI